MRKHAKGKRQGERGFTLVELLVVITIITLIMGIVGPRVLNYLTESKVKAARIQIEKRTDISRLNPHYKSKQPRKRKARGYTR